MPDCSATASVAPLDSASGALALQSLTCGFISEPGLSID